MDCALFRELTFDYLEGRLDALSLADFRDHFGRCETCSATLRAIEGQETLLTAAAAPKASDRLWGRIQKELQDREALAGVTRLPGLFRRAAAIAAAALIAVAAVTALAGRGGAKDLPLRVVDVSAEAAGGTLGRMVPGFENPTPAPPVLDMLLGVDR